MTSFDPADAVIAAALASGASHARAGETAGCSASTIKRRMTDPTFRGRVEELRANHVALVAQRLGELSGQALDALSDLLADADSPGPRLGSAKVVIDRLLSYSEAGEVERRLAALEARLAPRGNGRGPA